MDLVEKVTKTVRRRSLFSKGDSIILGLSGGPDSVCLFTILEEMAPEWGLRIFPVHVNHGIRGTDAEEDEKYVRKLAEKAGTELEVFRFDCRREAELLGLTPEEAGRKRRYQVFSERAEELIRDGAAPDSVVIATAHQADDQAETVLLRLVRGTGPDGLAGMPYARNDEAGHRVVRPLLDADREEIQEFLKQRDIHPRIDRTNLETDYARNKIRLELIPALKTYNPNIRGALLRLAESCREDRNYLTAAAESSLKKAELVSERDGKGPERRTILRLDREALRKEPGPILRRMIQRGFAEIGLDQDISFRHLADAEKMIRSGEVSASLDFPHGYRIRNVYGEVELLSPEGRKREGGAKSGGRIMEMSREEYEAWKVREKKPGEAVFDLDALEKKYGRDISGRICFRTRKPGDFLAIRSGRKKLQDIFVDDKVPRDFREQISFYAIGNEILFLPTQDFLIKKARFSFDFCVKEQTKNMIIIENDQSM